MCFCLLLCNLLPPKLVLRAGHTFVCNLELYPQHHINSMVVHTCSGSTWEVEAGASEFQGHPLLHKTLSQSKSEITKQVFKLANIVCVS